MTVRDVHEATVSSLRRRLAGRPCENERCGLGFDHPGPCWGPDTDAQLDVYAAALAEAKD